MKLTPLRVIITFMLPVLYIACSSPQHDSPAMDKIKEQQQVIAMLDSFNHAAAKADYKTYFNFYTEDAIFTGTDATERWDKPAFMAWAKPIFNKGHAWDFKALERHVYFDSTGRLAWLDELLNTRMKICRGSGVAVKQGNEWKIKQYILSATIPNEQLDTVIKIKAKLEDSLITVFSKK